MANRRKVSAERELRAGEVSTPTQEDEADILEEVDAERDEESGVLIADKDKVLEVGAFDAESVRENRRREKISKKKRGNVDGVSFNTGETLGTYDSILTCYPTSQVEIRVRRLTGSEVTRLITSGPRDAAELYNALMEIHGVYDEAKYEVIFVDSVSKKWFGKTKITLPNTRPQTQGQPPMQHQYPPGYPPQQFAPPQPAPAPQQPPIVQFAPPPAIDPMAMMQQTFDLFQRMQSSMQPPQPAYPQYQPPSQVPAMPPPPQTNDPAVQAAWMKQAFDLFQQMQSALQRPAQQPPPQPQQPPPQAAPAQAGPPGPPPRGYMWVWRHDFNSFVLMPETPPDRPAGPMFRGPRPAYDVQGDRLYAPQQQPQQPQQRPPTLVEQLRESTASMRATVEAMQEINSLLPGYGGQQEAPEPVVADDDSPVQVVNMGPAKGIINKHDGSTRWGETIVANLPDIFKWVGEQHKEILDRAERRQRQGQGQGQQSPPARQLRPGEVEVMPGQQPPPGYAFVPVEQEEELPPPPAHVPPPVSSPPRRTWEAPTIPEDRES